jgi:hypothetical protein
MVTVVPALVTVSVVNTLGLSDKEAQIRFTIDKGNNDFTDDSVFFTGMTLESAITGSGITIRNDDSEDVVTESNDADVTVNGEGETEIFNNDVYTIRVENDGAEVRISAYGIAYTINGEQYDIVNDKIINLGEYDSND